MRRTAVRAQRLCVPVFIVVLVSSGWVMVRSSSAVESSSAAIEVDVIGDSLSTGVATDGEGWISNAQQLVGNAPTDVQFVSAAENGAGYVAQGEFGDTFRDEVEQIVNRRTQIVLVFGSDNDVSQPGLEASVASTFQRVHELAPRARLIVVGPPAPPAQQVQQLEGIRDTLEAATRHAGGQFVDPLALRWFQDNAQADVGPDNEHPNEDGEHYLAELMTGILAPTIGAAAHRYGVVAAAGRRTDDQQDAGRPRARKPRAWLRGRAIADS